MLSLLPQVWNPAGNGRLPGRPCPSWPDRGGHALLPLFGLSSWWLHLPSAQERVVAMIQSKMHWHLSNATHRNHETQRRWGKVLVTLRMNERLVPEVQGPPAKGQEKTIQPMENRQRIGANNGRKEGSEGGREGEREERKRKEKKRVPLNTILNG